MKKEGTWVPKSSPYSKKIDPSDGRDNDLNLLLRLEERKNLPLEHLFSLLRLSLIVEVYVFFCFFFQSMKANVRSERDCEIYH